MLTVNTNIMALKSQASVSAVNRDHEISIQRLASGKRINSAKDDAAGVAIGSRLHSNVRSLNQSIINSMDALAVFDTAESAMQETGALLQRLRVLAIKAANDTLTSIDRTVLDSEKAQVIKEIDRIARTTSWAGQNLLDGTFVGKNFQIDGGFIASNSISVSIGDMSSVGNGINISETDYTPVRISNEVIVNTEITGTQQNAHVIDLIGGGYVVTWMTSSSTDIKAQMYDPNGNKIGTELSVNSSSSGFQGWGDTSPIAALNDGGFVIVYQSPDANGVGQYGQRFDSTGAKVGTEFSVNTTTLGDQNNASISAFDTGGFVVSWTSADDDGWGVFAQLYDSNGNKQGGEFQVNSSTSSSQWRSSVATLSDGTFVVAWESNGQDGDGDGIFGQIFNADGSKKGSEFRINSTTSLNQKEPTVKRLENDAFVVIWNTHDALSGEDTVAGQIYNVNGQPKFTELQINTTASSGYAIPQVTSLSDGGFMAVWRQLEFQGSNSDGSSYGIYGQRFDSGGNRLGSEIQVNTRTSGQQLNPSVAQLSNGQLIAVWHGPGDDDGSAIIKQKFEMAGTVNTTVSEVSLKTRSEASSSINKIDKALQKLSSLRASLGALSNRITYTMNHNKNLALNLSHSLSRIEDTDYAIETTRLVKQQIIQQAALAMLAQANAVQRNVLNLFQGKTHQSFV